MSADNHDLSEEQRETRRSQVRVLVTYIAAGFLFVGGAGLIFGLCWKGFTDKAVDLFMALLPVSTAVVTFWFAGRRPGSNEKHPEE